MKKAIALFALLIASVSYAQLQNSNWCFGNGAGLHFDGYSAPTNFQSQVATIEATATVSTTDGILMFYTDGVTVYRSDGSIMPNGTGLFGHRSDTHSANIIWRPANKKLYIITMDGRSGQERGLYYTEVDVNESNSAGIVNPNQKNIALRDENNVPINSVYFPEGNYSEKATTAKHCNGVDYWLVAQVGDKIYSYLVTSSGLSITPVAVSNALYDVQDFSLAGLGQIKISPDGNRIAIAYGYINNPDGILAIGSFDSNTGEVDFDTTVQVNAPDELDFYYGVEFSPYSKYVYFNVNKNLYRCNADNPANPNPELITATQGDSSSIQYRGQMQLAINGKIYIAHDNNDLPSNMLSVINNPDDPLNPDLHDNTVSLGAGSSISGLSSWVHWQTGNCYYSLQLYNRESNYLPYTYNIGNNITLAMNYETVSGQDITMNAGSYIEILPNSVISSGSTFLAQINPCEGCSSSQSRNNAYKKDDREGAQLQLYPNPSSDYIKIDTPGTSINSITVVSLDGKTVFSGQNLPEGFVLDVTGYIKGIYAAAIETSDGKTYNEKIVVR